ncbi:MAG: AvaI/BsoBI family type II restriction endonuclease [Candidatus Parvarchaeota archaeon]
MNQSNSYKSHLTSPKDLVTTHKARRAGFLALALEKNKRAFL